VIASSIRLPPTLMNHREMPRPRKIVPPIFEKCHSGWRIATHLSSSHCQLTYNLLLVAPCITATLAPNLTAAGRITTVTTLSRSSARAFGTTSAARSALTDTLLGGLRKLAQRHEKTEDDNIAVHTPDRPVGPPLEGARPRLYVPAKEAEESPSKASPAPSSNPTRRCPIVKYPLFEPDLSHRQQGSPIATHKRIAPLYPMSYTVQLLTAPTADTPGTTLMLQTSKQHYIFGSHAEGTQRAMTQMGARMSKVQDFFITGRMEWQNVGGLVGMALTLADSASTAYASSMEGWQKAGKKSQEPPARPKLNVYGPPNLKHTLATCRRFIFRKGVPIHATEYGDVPPEKNEQGELLPSWQDENIKVWAIPLKPSPKERDVKEAGLLARARASYERSGNNFEELQAPEGESEKERELRYERIRSAVVGYMFNSNWNFDTLAEHHISEVETGTAMFVRNPDTNRLEPYVGPKPGGTDPLPDIKVLTRTPWPGAKVMALPPTAPAPESISYIVCAHDARGTFNPKRARELGIKPGPQFGILSDGGSLQNDKGETITSDMVLGPGKVGQGVAILDVPSVEYLDSLAGRQELQSDHIVNRIRVVFWILGPGVSGHPKLQQCMQKLDKVEHIISSVDDCPNNLALDSVAAQTTRLAQIDPARYQIPFFDNTFLPQKSLYGLESNGRQGDSPKSTVADRGIAYNLMPSFASKPNVPPRLDTEAIKSEVDPEIISLAKAAQESVRNDHEALTAWRQLLARPDTEVFTLGTGSALPSKYRNVSATLLRVPGIGNYLFDCGENTLGQLQRVFSPDELVEVIKNLRMIWISHLHADHHLGTASMIKAWYKLVHNGVPTDERPTTGASLVQKASTFGLSVVSHDGMLKWLAEYSAVEDFGFSRILPFLLQPGEAGSDSGSRLKLLSSTNSPQIHQYNAVVLEPNEYEPILGLTDIQACYVQHCYGAMAVSLTFPRSASDPETVTPLKVSYSGDCRPSKNFAKIGRDSTVLIHEATFDDELSGDAKAKKHSTTSEALGIGAQMGAKAVVLTHFSQRYQKIPVLQTVQDGEQEDNLLDTNAMEDVKHEDEHDGDDGGVPTDAAATGPEDKPRETAIRRVASRGPALPSDKPQPPGLRHQPSSTHDLERVVKVKAKDMKVAISFDYMRVKIGEIAQMERFNEALERLLIKEVDEVEVEEKSSPLNKNGKKTSEDELGAEGKTPKKKKSKRNN
jgi:ribonuclease Z